MGVILLLREWDKEFIWLKVHRYRHSDNNRVKGQHFEHCQPMIICLFILEKSGISRYYGTTKARFTRISHSRKCTIFIFMQGSRDFWPWELCNIMQLIVCILCITHYTVCCVSIAFPTQSLRTFFVEVKRCAPNHSLPGFFNAIM